MEASTLGKAFDPFFTSRRRGIGMGLPLVRRIVKRHGGDIVLESTPGRGTTVRITLPATATANSEPDPEPVEALRTPQSYDAV